MPITKIISGGQTGADRAALDVALILGICTGGFIPKGRSAEDGQISEVYSNLVETDSSDSNVRTEANALFADGTLVVTHGEATGGTALTLRILRRSSKPYLHVDFTNIDFVDAVPYVQEWIKTNNLKTLNVAGPRASEDIAIYCHTKELLKQVLRENGNINRSYEVAFVVYQNAMDKWRHWDTIRWLVPNWFWAIAGAVVSLSPHSASSLQMVSGFLMVFGALSLYLLIRLL